MILSFSVDSMRPMIVAGLRQRAGAEVGGERVKRQTVRKRGPRAEMLLAQAAANGGLCRYALHLWWKSRTAERAELGVIAEPPATCWPISIDLADVRVAGAAVDAHEFARLDGFDHLSDMHSFFELDRGDVFYGILFKW